MNREMGSPERALCITIKAPSSARKSTDPKFTFHIPLALGVVFTPLFTEAIELTPTQNERIEMEHPPQVKKVYTVNSNSRMPENKSEMPKVANIVKVDVFRSKLCL